jgi:hypothetical protein
MRQPRLVDDADGGAVLVQPDRAEAIVRHFL